MTPRVWTGSGTGPSGRWSAPRATHVEVVGKIIYLRQHYHFGAKIAMYLKRYHQVQISNSGVWRILKRLESNRLPASQRHKRHDRRWRRYEKPLPGHRVQLDVKFIQPLPGVPKAKKYYPVHPVGCTNAFMQLVGTGARVRRGGRAGGLGPADP